MSIPDPYVWSDEFKVFYESLDEEHKGLFCGIFDMAAFPNDQSKVDVLVKRVVDHFTNEENMFTKANYADMTSHKKIHADFVGKIEGLKVPIDKETIDFAKSWLVTHIKGVDFKYKGKLG